MAYNKKQIEEYKETIIEGLYDGRSLKNILDNDDSLPNRTRVYEWLNSEHSKYDEKFRNNYTQAREDTADLDAEKIEEINDDVRNKIIDPQQARVISDNLKWIAGKKKPKKYGERLDLGLVVKTKIKGITFDEE